jgi:hypothetical protein
MVTDTVIDLSPRIMWAFAVMVVSLVALLMAVTALVNLWRHR